MDDNEKELKGFEVHGVELTGETGNQKYGECPFCGREKKFYVNKENGLWDCKVCGVSGNFPQFLEKIQRRNAKELKSEHLRQLALDRKLPEEAFKDAGLGWDGKRYTFPTRDGSGKVLDLRIYKPGSKLLGTTGCKVGLWNAQELGRAKPTIPVYLCEGEWDGMALRWLARLLKKEVIVVAVPGANTFKKEWCTLFDNRKVFCLYDNDEAGVEGQLLVKERLTGTAKSIEYLHWPAEFPIGFDIRDLISRRAVRMKKPNGAWKRIHDMLKPVPVKEFGALPEGKEITESGHPKDPEKVTPMAFSELEKVIRKWLFLNNMDGIEIALAAIISNKMGGDPLWMFLVAPPGGAKTEIISMFQGCVETYFASSLTPHALISGAGGVGGNDPSLIPKLDGLTLLIKDFTTILSKKEQERDEIFGILRDAYDGSCSKVFGTGHKKSYVSKFSILSAVTPKIYELAESHQSLGERFLKFCIGDNLDHFSENQIIERAILNTQKEGDMRREMQGAVAHFVAWKLQQMGEREVPTISKEMLDRLIALARYGARLRGIVARDKFRPELMHALPSSEVGTRLGKQLGKLAVSLAYLHDRKEVTEHEMRLVTKCLLDTIPQRAEVVIRGIYKELLESRETVGSKELARLTRFPQTTVARLLADMNMLKVVERTGIITKYVWRLAPYALDLIKKGNIYQLPDTLERKSMADNEPEPGEPKKKMRKAVIKKAVTAGKV